MEEVMEPDDSDPRVVQFQSIDDVDDFISEQTGHLMDINSEMIQYSRKALRAIDDFAFRFNAIVTSIKEAHAIGAMMTSDLTTDMIMEEFAIENVEDDLEEEDDDE